MNQQTTYGIPSYLTIFIAEIGTRLRLRPKIYDYTYNYYT